MRVAAGATAVAVVTTFVLFVYTLALRAATVAGEKRRREVIARWRTEFAAAMLSERHARGRTLPRYTRRERTDLLEEWNRSCESVGGVAAANLIIVGERLGFDVLARHMLQRRKLSTRLVAVQTLGHLRSRAEWSRLAKLLDHDNTALSITAARALAIIDAREAASLVMARVITRGDWPLASVSRILKDLGADLVTQPLCNAILTSDADTSVRLLKYAELARDERVDQLIEMLLRERQEPAVLAAALKAVRGGTSLPQIEQLTAHGAWYVRMQAARLLGRLGQERDVALLETLLADREWWVRYRAAQAIVALPFVGLDQLGVLLSRQRDPFAHDMLAQAMAEVGLA
jgi:HEAT repeat protein